MAKIGSQGRASPGIPGTSAQSLSRPHGREALEFTGLGQRQRLPFPTHHEPAARSLRGNVGGLSGSVVGAIPPGQLELGSE